MGRMAFFRSANWALVLRETRIKVPRLRGQVANFKPGHVVSQVRTPAARSHCASTGRRIRGRQGSPLLSWIKEEAANAKGLASLEPLGLMGRGGSVGKMRARADRRRLWVGARQGMRE